MMRSVFVAAALMLLVAGCAEDEPERAQVRFIHSVDDIGTLEVLVDNEMVMRLSPGKLSDSVEIDPGQRTISLRSQGAVSSLMKESLSFKVQGYLIAFTGRVSDASLSMLSVDNPAPAVQSGKAAVEVVNLYEGRYKFDVYVDQTKVASEVDFGTTTDFAQIPIGTAVIKVHNTGDDPNTTIAVATLEHHFNEGEALMVLLESGAGGNVAITLISVREG